MCIRDRWCTVHLFSCPTEDAIRAASRESKYDAFNEQARAIWVASHMAFGLLSLASMDWLDLSFALFVVPLAWLTSQKSSTMNWANQLAQSCHLTLRLWNPNPGMHPGASLFYVGSLALWNQAAVRRPSASIGLHLLTVWTVLVSPLLESACACALLGIAMLALQCYRRCPGADTDQEPQGPLERLRGRCATVVTLLLESGDEIRADNMEILNRLLTELTGTRYNISRPGAALSLTHSGTGCGTGTGWSEHEQPGAPQEESHGARGGMPEEPGLNALMGAVLHMRAPREPAPIANKFAMYAGGDETPTAFAQGAPPPQWAMPEVPREVASALSDRLLSMSFDALAQVELSTGTVMWANPAFRELVLAVGAGNEMAGLSVLIQLFLQALPVDLRCHQATVGNVTLCSATQIARIGGLERVLWAIHRPVIVAEIGGRDPGFSGTYGYQSIEPTFAPRQEVPVDKVVEDPDYPDASKFPDTRTMILAGENPATGVRAKRQMKMLWHKYGQKLLTVGKDTKVLERGYYKCCERDCKARLRIDTVSSTGEHVCTLPSGAHNHKVAIAPERTS
eukprot:TRINITY_DN186_c0_g1_i2.p1 TRINITY_DN186_c0_g1~~TRINITY_DN186_c0_g1_i2.p1  ORF type:complete len:567 (-),score=96.23 TRINITY_DN186_c0_g1_i2:98-1798(-)